MMRLPYAALQPLVESFDLRLMTPQILCLLAQCRFRPLALGDLLTQSCVGSGQLGRALLDAHLQLFMCLFQGFLCQLELGNIVADSLNANRPSLLVSDYLDLTTDPYHAVITGDKPIYRSKRLVQDQEAGELDVPTRFVVRVQPLIPEHRVFQPLLPGKAQKGLDLRADIELAAR